MLSRTMEIHEPSRYQTSPMIVCKPSSNRLEYAVHMSLSMFRISDKMASDQRFCLACSLWTRPVFYTTRLALRMQVIRSASILVSLVEVGVWCSLSAITRGLVSTATSQVNTIASASTSITDQDVRRKSRIPWRS